MSLRALVDIYRVAAKRAFSDAEIEVESALSAELQRLVLDIWSAGTGAGAGRIDWMVVDGAVIHEPEDLPETGEHVQVTIRLPAGDANRFYESAADLLTRSDKAAKGEMPADYYLVEEDWYSADPGGKPPEIEKIEAFGRLIAGLEKFARFSVDPESRGQRRLLFVYSDEKSGVRTIDFEARITPTMLACDMPDLDVLEKLRESTAGTDPHHGAKVDVFTATLGEFLAETPAAREPFEYLVERWGGFAERYKNNFSTYISGFGFNKATREVAEEMFTLAERFSKLTSDIAGKMLGVPVSAAAVFVLSKAESALEERVIVAALIVTSLIIAIAVYHQWQELQRVIHAKDVVLEALEGRNDQFPDGLRTEVTKFKNSAERDAFTVNAVLWVYFVFALLPAGAGIAWCFFGA